MKTAKIVVGILVILLAVLAIVNIWQAQVIANQRSQIKWFECVMSKDLSGCTSRKMNQKYYRFYAAVVRHWSCQEDSCQ